MRSWPLDWSDLGRMPATCPVPGETSTFESTCRKRMQWWGRKVCDNSVRGERVAICGPFGEVRCAYYLGHAGHAGDGTRSVSGRYSTLCLALLTCFFLCTLECTIVWSSPIYL